MSVPLGDPVPGSVPPSRRGLTVASLVVEPSAALLRMSSPVGVFDASLRSLVGEMFVVMRLLAGVGLAAPQVGVPLRVFVYEASGSSGVMVNPVIGARSFPYHPDEGCLSVPGRFFRPLRHRFVDVSWCDVDGTMHRGSFTGLLAEIVEHEVDHLDGVLLDRCPQAPPGL
jgi:peptide deformylase